ncbi:MAG: hypothetical protein E6K87_03050 [Thaumarchaeota archaeon]|nr:MAG: hypothetical protein E6K87_03050 [Nitrososphaerota archaeon]
MKVAVPPGGKTSYFGGFAVPYVHNADPVGGGLKGCSGDMLVNVLEPLFVTIITSSAVNPLGVAAGRANNWMFNGAEPAEFSANCCEFPLSVTSLMLYDFAESM